MRTFEIEVWWDGQVVVGVSAVSPLRTTTDVITYRDQTGAAYKVPGRTDTATVTLQRGVSEDLAFDIWATGPLLKKDVELRLTDPSDGLSITYRLPRCWVSEYAVAPDLDTGTVVESLTLVVSGWRRVTPAPSALADDFAKLRAGEVRRIPLGELMTGNLEETQKRLDQLISDAEQSGAVLLLDEADALFSRRTDVADAHDRYQTTETDSLLDRLASFQGQVLVVPPEDPPHT